MENQYIKIFKTFNIILIMALLYNISGFISINFFSQNTILSISAFIPEGIALAGVLIYGYRILPGIFLGQLILAQLEWSHFQAAVEIASVNTFEAFVGYQLFYRLKLNRELKTLKDIIGLILLSTLILQPISAIINNYILAYNTLLNIDDIIHNSLFWWFGNIMGQILFTPLLLLLYRYKDELDISYIIYAILTTIIYNYLIEVYLPIENISLLLLLTIPLSIYVSTKNIVYGIVVSVTFALSCMYMTHIGIGFFTIEQSPIDSTINLNYFILSHILLVLLIGTIFNEKEEAIQELKSMAHFDYLTGLPNRHLLRTEIHHAVLMAKDYHQKSAICFIDLDEFKEVNDQYGHHIGDKTLKKTVSFIRKHLKTEDALLRLGGDEFLLIVNNYKNKDDLDETLNNILQSMQQPMFIENNEINISFSIGVAICPDHGTTVQELMNIADNAMYKAKSIGKNCIYYA